MLFNPVKLAEKIAELNSPLIMFTRAKEKMLITQWIFLNNFSGQTQNFQMMLIENMEPFLNLDRLFETPNLDVSSNFVLVEMKHLFFMFHCE